MTLRPRAEPELISGRDVQASAMARLRESSYREIHQVSCEFHEGVLTLRGCLPTYYLRQIAQNLVGDLEGVVEIDDRLEVARPPAWSEPELPYAFSETLVDGPPQ
jgi:osmotically-inducible protein OsmY